MAPQREREDPGLNDYVRERLARLLAENRPRRARTEPGRTTAPERAPAQPPVISTGSAGSLARFLPADGAPELLPSDDDDSPAWVRSPAPDPVALRAGASPGATPDAGGSTTDTARSTGDDLLDDWGDPPRRRFSRAHLGVVGALLIIGLLVVAWTSMRARPVAIASSPVTSAAATTGAPGPPAGSTPVRGATSTTAAGSPTPRILVHVLGAVKRQGVVTLSDRARVQDALAAAGGLRRNAAPGDLNLAQMLTDGQQVVIGTTAHPGSEVRDESPSSGSTRSGPSRPGGDASGAGDVVDLNRASASELEELPGVGPVTAAKIVTWREEHTRFNRVEELQEVDGIGPKTYAQIAPHARV